MVQWKPNKTIAVVLGLVFHYFAMLYVARIKWAAFYFAVSLVVLGIEFSLAGPWLKFVSLVNVVGVICAVHAYRLALTADEISARPWYSTWYGLAGLYMLMFLAVFSFRVFLYEPFRMPSGSMLPAIKVGSYLWVKKYGYGNYGTFGVKVARAERTAGISRGDLIAFEYPVDRTTMYVKRVIGMPGDAVEYKNNQLTINGEVVNTSHLGAYFDTINGRSYEYLIKQ